MILEMSRVSLIMAKSAQAKALDALATANLFHVNAQENYNDSIAKLHHQLSRAEIMLRYLPDLPGEPITTRTVDITKLQDDIERMYQQREELDKQQKHYLQQIEQYAIWGDFSVEDLHDLQARGYFIRLYKVDARTYQSLSSQENTNLFLCKVLKGIHYIALYSESEEHFPALESLELPPMSVGKMRNAVHDIAKSIQDRNNDLINLNKDRTYLEQHISRLEESIRFEKTVANVEDYEELAVLHGFVPTEDLLVLKDYAKKHGWALHIQEAITGDEDADAEIPTKIKPGFFGKFSQPILDALEFTPGYQEIDISNVMTFFFAIFFSMIVGDAAYGSIFLLLSLFGITKLKMANKPVTPLLPYVAFMSALTVMWGILTDSWFGFSLAQHVPLFASLKNDWLGEDSNLQLLSFTIGITHLTIAHLWALGIKLKSNIKAVPSEIGQLMMLFGFFILIVNMLIGPNTFVGAVPSWNVQMIIIGLVLRLLFGEQQANVNLGAGFVNGLKGAFANVLGAVGNFSDTLSYIRLYAVGLAGFSIASSFNELALSSPVFMTPLILIFAHTLNLVLGILGVLVHAVRLNSLEFSGHIGLVWSGVPYEPFKAKNAFVESDRTTK